MKVIIEKPDGSPYLTLSDEGLMISVQMHDSAWMGELVKIPFDRRTIPPLIDAPTRLNRGAADATIRPHYFTQDIK